MKLKKLKFDWKKYGYSGGTYYCTVYPFVFLECFWTTRYGKDATEHKNGFVFNAYYCNKTKHSQGIYPDMATTQKVAEQFVTDCLLPKLLTLLIEEDK